MAGNPALRSGAFKAAVDAAAFKGGEASVSLAMAGRVTYDDVIVRTLVCLAVLGAGAGATFVMPLAWSASTALLAFGGGAAFILSIVNTFKTKPVPALILAYALTEGLVLGAITRVLDVAAPGIGLQAVVGTFAVAAMTLFLYRSGRVRATPGLVRFFLIAAAGYLAFSVVNLLVMAFDPGLGAWGLNSGVSVLGMPLGVLVGVFAVVLASISLIIDFGKVQEAVEAGAPKSAAWSAAFGLTVTLVWLYLEILRLLSIAAQIANAFSGND